MITMSCGILQRDRESRDYEWSCWDERTATIYGFTYGKISCLVVEVHGKKKEIGDRNLMPATTGHPSELKTMIHVAENTSPPATPQVFRFLTKSPLIPYVLGGSPLSPWRWKKSTARPTLFYGDRTPWLSAFHGFTFPLFITSIASE